MGTIHVVGAGLAGLACALGLAEAGRRVVIHEAAPQAGGRCRSFHDAPLDRTLDNGSHLVLSGNRSLAAFLARTGGVMTPLRPAAFPFVDRRTGAAWTLRPGGLWLFDPARRVPGGGAAAHAAALRTLVAGAGATVADVLPPGTPLHERLWAPLAVAGLNGPPDRVSARLFGAILRETLLRGESACRPMMAPHGLSAALVAPALARLAALGATLRPGVRAHGLEVADSRAAAFVSGADRIVLGDGDSLVLAVPPWAATAFLPGLAAPPAGAAIVNAHFRLDAPVPLPGGLPFLGLVGATAEWLFIRGDVLSVTVSAADALAARPAAEVAALLWADCAAVLGRSGGVPPVRVVKERRATFDQSPAHASLRPPPRTRLDNLFLAGDWTDTGLPATLEGAIRSGDAAARAVLRRRRGFPFGARRHM